MKLNRWYSVMAALVIPLLVWLAYTLRADQQVRAEEEPATLVQTMPVLVEARAFPLHTSGKLASKTEIKLSFKTGGIVQRILVDEGRSVRKGQLLAQLNLAEIEAQVKQARSAWEKAERDVQRAQNLFADSVITLAQLQDARTALEVAAADLRIAEFNLKHSRIYAPSNGRILRRFVEQNELVGQGVPVLFFASTENDWILRVSVTDRDVLRLQPGDSASVVFDAYPERRFAGAIAEIGETADPATGTFEVEVRVDAGEMRLISGFFAKADLFPSARKPYAIVPIEALYMGDGNHGYVFALDPTGKHAVKRAIKIARILDAELAVSGGLDGVQEVITAGVAYLTDGAPVRLPAR